MNKRFFRAGAALLTSLLFTVSLAACGSSPAATATPAATVAAATATPAPAPAEKVKFSVAAFSGPTGMGLAQVWDKADKNQLTYTPAFELVGAPDQVTAKLISGEYQVAAVPTNLAAVLYQKTGGKIQLAAVNTLGVLYLMENGDTVKSVKDLKGKKIIASGKGSVPEYALNWLLEQNGLAAGKDVDIDWKSEHAEVAKILASGDAAVALLPQPFVTTVAQQNPKIRVALDLNAAWDEASRGASKLAMGCIVVQKDFAEKNKAVLNAFLADYKASVDFVNSKPAEASVIIADKKILPAAKVAEAAIPRSAIVFMDAKSAKPVLTPFFEVLFKYDPKSVGGKMVDDGFYVNP